MLTFLRFLVSEIKKYYSVRKNMIGLVYALLAIPTAIWIILAGVFKNPLFLILGFTQVIIAILWIINANSLLSKYDEYKKELKKEEYKNNESYPR